ncbi:lysophosphatidic acid phosphatase type 6-like [Paramacrobiotus metropolitanus]|uniref:lysophosphatidic acid phosphatase type 6-like n=1 Tax=Paramacrobiotus metropolitanus TaxID=2943436 RepID=UPI0024461E7D|nr:lysophosphatidic acid phosphatase type 6-like [Paramacrobiotus metropolitanus]
MWRRAFMRQIAAGSGIISLVLLVKDRVNRNLVYADAMNPNNLSNLKLRHVQVFVRHGARTPLRILPYLEQVTWSLDDLMADPPDVGVLPYVVKDLRGQPLEMGLFESLSRSVTFKGGAFAGQLTKPGKRQMYDLGQNLRKEYIEGHKLLKPDFDRDQTFIRSTNITRTTESAVWMVSGMYNTVANDPKYVNMEPLTVFATTEEDEILYPNHTFCGALNRLSKRITQHMHEITGLLADRDALEQAIDYDLKTHKRRLDFVDLRDEVAARLAHDMEVHPVLREWFDKIDNYAVQILARMVTGNDPSLQIQRELLRLACGPALRMVLDNMFGVIQRKNRYKMEVYACHDSMMISLVIALKIFNGQWPPYAADLRFELLEDEKGQFFVRVKYLGQDQELPIEGGGAYSAVAVYTIEKFEEFLSELAINQRHLKDLCSLKSAYTEPLQDLDDSEGSYFTAGKKEK